MRSWKKIGFINFLDFNGNIYKQISGTAMGNKSCPDLRLFSHDIPESTYIWTMEIKMRLEFPQIFTKLETLLGREPNSLDADIRPTQLIHDPN